MNGEPNWESVSCGLCGTEAASRVTDVRRGGGVSSVVECDGCGLRRLEPRPTAVSLPTFYGARYTAFVGRTRSPAKQRVWELLRDVGSGARAAPAPVRRATRAVIRQSVDIHVDLDGARPRVLDVGCGYGDLLIYLQQRGCAVQGTDLSAQAASVAARYGVNVHVGPVESAPFPAASFDVAVMCHSLEHISNPLEAIQAVRNLLNGGGELHIAVPNGASCGLRVEGDDWFHLSWPIHLWFFAEADLCSLLTRHGFAITSISYRMTWSPHGRRWLKAARAGGGLSATIDLIHILASSVLRPRGRDVVRVVARSVSDATAT